MRRLFPIQEALQRAKVTSRGAATEFIAGLYDEGVELVVVLGNVAALHGAHARNRMPWFCAGIKDVQPVRLCAADGVLDERADLLVSCFRMENSVPFQDSARVSIHNKNRMVAAIEQNRIGRFRSNPV